jgi:hypothetical protein
VEEAFQIDGDVNIATIKKDRPSVFGIAPHVRQIFVIWFVLKMEMPEFTADTVFTLLPGSYLYKSDLLST